MPILTLTAPTWAKQQPIQSELLTDQDKHWMPAGDYPCLAYGSALNHHVLVTFDIDQVPEIASHPSRRNTWLFYQGHVQVEGNIPENQPADRALTQRPQGQLVTIVGRGEVGLNSSITGAVHFTWAEATRGGSRMPVNAGITNQIIEIAKAMDNVRAMLGGHPITVTSWYRPPAVNRAVGGASQSTHLQGHAVDFQHPRLRPRDIYNRLDPWWGNRGGLAWCDSPGRSFVHLDARGFRARWLY